MVVDWWRCVLAANARYALDSALRLCRVPTIISAQLRNSSSASKFAELFFFGTVCFYSGPERSEQCSATSAVRNWTAQGSFVRSAVQPSALCLLLLCTPPPRRWRTRSRNLRDGCPCLWFCGRFTEFSKRSGPLPFIFLRACRALGGGQVAIGAGGLAIGCGAGFLAWRC